MNQDDVKNNLLAPAQWLRILLMAGYLLAVWVLGMLLLVIIITQTLTVLILGEPNENLRRFGVLCAAYLYQVVNFLVYGTEEKPFPFSPFPGGDDEEAPPAPAETPAATETTADEAMPGNDDLDLDRDPDRDGRSEG
jgi:hypothetical protein